MPLPCYKELHRSGSSRTFWRVANRWENVIDDGDLLFAPRHWHSRRIYSDNETSEGVSKHEEKNNDTKRSLKNFHEVAIVNEGEYNPRPVFLETTGSEYMPPNNSKPIYHFNLFFNCEYASFKFCKIILTLVFMSLFPYLSKFVKLVRYFSQRYNTLARH